MWIHFLCYQEQTLQQEGRVEWKSLCLWSLKAFCASSILGGRVQNTLSHSFQLLCNVTPVKTPFNLSDEQRSKRKKDSICSAPKCVKYKTGWRSRSSRQYWVFQTELRSKHLWLQHDHCSPSPRACEHFFNLLTVLVWCHSTLNSDRSISMKLRDTFHFRFRCWYRSNQSNCQLRNHRRCLEKNHGGNCINLSI